LIYYRLSARKVNNDSQPSTRPLKKLLLPPRRKELLRKRTKQTKVFPILLVACQHVLIDCYADEGDVFDEETERIRAEQAVYSNLFKGCIFFLSREVRD